MSLVAICPTISGAQFIPFPLVLRNAPLIIAAELSSTWSLALAKVSVSALLIRLQQIESWKVFLYAVAIIQFLTALCLTAIHTTRCIPLAGLWDLTISDKHCWTDAAFGTSLTITSTIVAVTDLIYALIPITFLRNMSHPIRDRVVIGVLMSLGIIATGASIAKAVTAQGFDRTSDPISQGTAVALWAGVEEQLAVIAACIPCLRAPFQRLLSHLGLLRTGYSSTNDNFEYASSLSKQSKPVVRQQVNGLSPSSELKDDSEEEILDRGHDISTRKGSTQRYNASIELIRSSGP
jgi:hypothetical protein